MLNSRNISGSAQYDHTYALSAFDAESMSPAECYYGSQNI